MFRVKVDRYEFEIRFTHMRPEEAPRDGKRNVQTRGGLTYCYIRENRLNEKGEKPIIRVGEARCSRLDPFCYEKGRRVSLAKALREFPRHARAAIWAAYWSRKCNPTK